MSFEDHTNEPPTCELNAGYAEIITKADDLLERVRQTNEEFDAAFRTHLAVGEAVQVACHQKDVVGPMPFHVIRERSTI